MTDTLRTNVTLHRMPNGDLLADPGQPRPVVPLGFVPDAHDPYRLHPRRPKPYRPPKGCDGCRGL